MDAWEIGALIAANDGDTRRYREFVQRPSMSAGIFILPAGASDNHAPHDRDELYHVIRGRGTLQVAGEDRAVTAGSTMFVAAGVEHHFHSITEELVMLVFFGGEITAP